MLRSIPAHLVVGAVVISAATMLYGDSVISAPAVYGFLFVAVGIIGVGFFRWEARNYRERQRRLR